MRLKRIASFLTFVKIRDLQPFAAAEEFLEYFVFFGTDQSWSKSAQGSSNSI